MRFFEARRGGCPCSAPLARRTPCRFSVVHVPKKKVHSSKRSISRMEWQHVHTSLPDLSSIHSFGRRAPMGRAGCSSRLTDAGSLRILSAAKSSWGVWLPGPASKQALATLVSIEQHRRQGDYILHLDKLSCKSSSRLRRVHAFRGEIRELVEVRIEDNLLFIRIPAVFLRTETPASIPALKTICLRRPTFYSPLANQTLTSTACSAVA